MMCKHVDRGLMPYCSRHCGCEIHGLTGTAPCGACGQVPLTKYLGILGDCYCGDLEWSIRLFGLKVHKVACPTRVEPYHQGNVHILLSTNICGPHIKINDKAVICDGLEGIRRKVAYEDNACIEALKRENQ